MVMNRGESPEGGPWLVAADPLTPEEYKRRLAIHEELVHITVEVHRCRGEHPHCEELMAAGSSPESALR